MSDFTPPKWMRTWFRTATPLAIWDAAFLLLRPYTYSGHFLGDTVYKAYNDLYVVMDTSYSRAVYEAGGALNGYVTSVALSQYITDIPLQILALRLWSSSDPACVAQGSLVALVSQFAVFVRTGLFIGSDVLGGFQSTKNGAHWMKLLYYGTNGAWLVSSAMIVAHFYPKFAEHLRKTLPKRKD
ncbi:hypothetical protein M427DRAFT_132489 [Gonapodya prolifera JEL478]|uniref:EXPERA domain-containing protein n=1 Tax=Gonapodya prolifera (strain JEL478) TaxID=1344416 RepID=A0A139AQI4_GONPJ|nr:hypothetical protein M427DRAFT_132489 [Gonapodya prolifera JEL478]|eukprot:KXS19017.1 hypothetical protein M427DRAFT_132489 [Gonapodya prolifera JEL478]